MVEGRRGPRFTSLAVAGAVAGGLVAAAIAAGVLYGTGTNRDESGAGTLRVALATFGAEVLDPSMDAQAGLAYNGHMYDHFVGATPDGRPSSRFGVLERWNSGANAQEYILELRQGMTWHDGVDVTSEDIDFSLAHYSRSAAACVACGALSGTIADVRILDRYRLSIKLNEPDIAFIGRLGPEQEDIPLLPNHNGVRAGEDGLNDSTVGSGPWRFVTRVTGESIEYEANQDYWNPDRIPGFQRLRLVQVPSPETRVAMLRAGTVDIAPVDIRDVEPLKGEGFAIQGPRFVVSTTLRFFMSYDSDYLTSKREFRQALVLAVDVPAIIEKIYPPEAVTLASGSAMFGPMAEGHDPSLPSYPYDPARARELLDRIGYDGETVRLISIPAYGLTELPRFNEMMVDYWRRIGLTVEVVPSEYGLVKVRYSSRPQRFDDMRPAPVFHGAHINRPGGAVNSIHRYLTGSPQSLLSYPDLDRGDRIYADVTAIKDEEQRRARLLALNRELYDEYWAAPFLWRHELYAVSPKVTGWTPTSGTTSTLHFETVKPAD